MKPIALKNAGPVRIFRDETGILHVKAETEADLWFGQGYVQALDRGLQMLTTRIVARGQASEVFAASDEMLAADRFFRKMNLAGDVPNQVALLNAKTRALARAYCDGVNAYFRKNRPWELRLLRYRAPEWKIEDSILVLRVLGYINTQLTQNRAERFLLDCIQADASADMLNELFPGLDPAELDLELLKKITFLEENTPPETILTLLPLGVPSPGAVLAPKKSASGGALLAIDAGAVSNHLPAGWQEMTLSWNERVVIGACLPGVPGILCGRNDTLAWGATEAQLDGLDSWVEECREGKFKRGSATKTEWVRFHERREVIRRRGRRQVEFTFYENEHGVLDGFPTDRGYYLTTRWALARDSGARSIEVAFQLAHAPDVKTALDLVAQFELSFNWVLADRGGQIACQMSGRLPRRRAGVSGLPPRPGWDARNDWKGFVNFRNLPRKTNPREGYLLAGAGDLQRAGKIRPVNLPLTAYRTERMAQLIKQKGRLSLEDLRCVQNDLYSLQAERIMKLVAPHLPDTESGRVLREWNFFYDPESQGAYLFEKLYEALIDEILRQLPALRTVARLRPIDLETFACFDAVLLARGSAWFADRSREDCIRAAVERAFARGPRAGPRPWKIANSLTLTHTLFRRMFGLSAFASFSLAIPGGRATVRGGLVGGAEAGLLPVYRLLVDLAVPGILRALAGGPSDRRFSRWYKSDLAPWAAGEFGRLVARDEAEAGAEMPAP